MDAITQKDYWEEIESLAKQCIEEAKEQDRELSEVIWETCDGHQWVIYTAYHHQVLQHCDADPAERFEDMGGPDMSKGWDNIVMQATYLVLEGDVSERAQRMLTEMEENEEGADV